MIWFALWFWLSSEKPSNHPYISALEKSHIENSLENSNAKAPTLCTLPWVSLVTSLPVYAIIIANFARGWTSYLLRAAQPMFLHMRFGSRPGFWSNLLPHILMTIIVPLTGLLADLLRMKQVLKTTTVRKIFGCGGFGGEAVFLLLVTFADNQTLASVGIAFAVASSAIAVSGLNANLLEIAPRQAAILTGLSNTMGTLAAMLCPIFLFTGNPQTSKDEHVQWMKVFIKVFKNWRKCVFATGLPGSSVDGVGCHRFLRSLRKRRNSSMGCRPSRPGGQC